MGLVSLPCRRRNTRQRTPTPIRYAYEYGLTGLRNFNSGSHELMLSYEINKKPVQRPLFCPAYR